MFVILGVIGVLVVLVALMAILRSQGVNPVILAILGGITSMLAIYVTVVAILVIIQYNKEGPRPDGMPNSYSCIVTVVQDGAPLEGARVTLHPTDQDLVKWGAISGMTDAKGNAVMTISNGAYDGAFKGEYKVTVHKTEMSNDRSIFFIHLVDQKYNAPHTTPLELKISRATKAKVDLGPAVRIEQKSFEAQREEQNQELLKVVYPCNITILRDGQPVPDAEVELEPDDFIKYASARLDFKGTTDARGIASIAPVPRFTSMRGDPAVTYQEGVPADTFQVKVKIKNDSDFELRTSGKKLGEITISGAFEQEYDLKNYPDRFSF